MRYIWLERYGSLFFEEINFVKILHSWKKWEPKHRRVFGSEAADSLYPFRPSPLPSTPAQSQPNSSPFLSPIQIWIEAQVRPTWSKKHQALSIFFTFFFHPLAWPTCLVLLCPSAQAIPLQTRQLHSHRQASTLCSPMLLLLQHVTTPCCMAAGSD